MNTARRTTLITLNRESRNPNELMQWPWETRHLSIFARVPALPLDEIIYVMKTPSAEIAQYVCDGHNMRLKASTTIHRRRKNRDAPGRVDGSSAWERGEKY